MAVVQFPSSERHNPLNDMEDLLEASGYSHSRETDNRLTFMCESKQSCYNVALEWHMEFEAVKASVIIEDCKDGDENLIDMTIEAANKTSWHGFFIRDGVGNIAFKTIIKLIEDCPIACLSTIEDAIDKGIEEADRLYVSLAIDSQQNDNDGDLFTEEEWKVENLALMFSEPKGNA